MSKKLFVPEICAPTDQMWAHDTEAHLERTRARLARFGVDLRDDATRGRCLVAAKDFKRGDLVLASAPFGLPVPFVQGGGPGRCAGCFRDASDEAWEDGGARSPETCAGCGVAWFCSERCKACAIAGGHASECAALRAFKKKHPGADAGSVSAEFGALSALYRQCAKAYPEAAEPADEALPYLVPTLGDKADYGARRNESKAEVCDFTGEDDVEWARTQIASARAVGLIPKSVTDAAARAEISRSRVNDFFIQRWTGGDPEPIAAAVFPLGALLNHSCAPTCVASYRLETRRNTTDDVSTTDGPTWIQEFRCAVSELRLGDELTHAYVDAGDWTNHRRAALLDRYGFVCNCARCPKDEHGAPFDPPKPIPRRGDSDADAQTRTPPEKREDSAETALSARRAFCRESNWAALAMPNDKRAQVTIEIASKLLHDAERAEEVSNERELAEKAAGLLRGISVNAVPENPENPYALGAAAPFPTTSMRARALAMASNMAMFESDFEAALRLGEELVACLVEAYGTKWHAKIAYELFKLASVAGDGLGDAARAAAKFREALEIGEVALGGDAWMCRKAREYLEGTSSS